MSTASERNPGTAVDRDGPAPIASGSPPAPDAPEANPVAVLKARQRGWLALVAGDVAAVCLAALLVPGAGGLFALAAGAALIACLTLWDLYRIGMAVHVLDDMPRILAATVTAGASAASAWVVIFGAEIEQIDIAFLTALVAFVVLLRALSYQTVRAARRRGRLQHRTVIMGAGEVARHLGDQMRRDPTYGCELVGFVDSAPALPEEFLPAEHLGPSEQLARIIADNRIERVVLSFLSAPESELVPFVRTCDRSDVEIYLVPRLYEMIARSPEFDEIDGIALMRLHRTPFRSVTWWLKRAMDIAVSGTALLVLSPLLGLLALMDRIVDGPGVIFRQERVGIDGQPFDVLKFRSLRPATSQESATNWNVKNDDRLSWFGKFLRRSSLDELPQLWNILRGDMSLVGPRPERPHFVETFSDEFERYGARHRVPCGLTGWAQIHGLRGDTSIRDRVRYDNYYIQNWSLWLDIKIILRTVTAFTKGSG